MFVCVFGDALQLTDFHCKYWLNSFLHRAHLHRLPPGRVWWHSVPTAAVGQRRRGDQRWLWVVGTSTLHPPPCTPRWWAPPPCTLHRVESDHHYSLTTPKCSASCSHACANHPCTYHLLKIRHLLCEVPPDPPDPSTWCISPPPPLQTVGREKRGLPGWRRTSRR